MDNVKSVVNANENAHFLRKSVKNVNKTNLTIAALISGSAYAFDLNMSESPPHP